MSWWNCQETSSFPFETFSCRSALPPEDPYDRIKARLVTDFAPSVYLHRAENIINHPDLGDRRPSAMMAAMLAELPEDVSPGILFQAHFLRRLPADIKRPLCAKKFASPRDMAEYADRLWDGRSYQPIATVEVSPVLVRRVIYPSLQKSNYNQRRRSPSHQSRHRRHATPPPVGDSCFYHEKFGSSAQKCRAPCFYSSGNGKVVGGCKFLRTSAANSFSFIMPSVAAVSWLTREQPEA